MFWFDADKPFTPKKNVTKQQVEMSQWREKQLSRTFISVGLGNVCMRMDCVG